MQFEKIKEIIDRYLKGNQGISEQRAMENWLDSLTSKPLPHSSEKLQSIGHDMWQHIEHRRESHDRVSRMQLLWSTIGSVAATVLIGFALFKHISSNQDVHYNTGLKETKEILLADGSSITLRENTHLSVSHRYRTDSIRSVELSKGEAFFSIQKDHHRPFVVKNKLMQTEVLGTSFTIQTQDALGKWNIRVKTGQVRVSQMGWDKGHYTLLANDSLAYDQEQNSVDYIHLMPAPREKLLFQDASLQQVIQKLAKQYKRNIQVADEIGQAHQFSGEFDADEPFASVLEIICFATGTQYHLEKDTIILSPQE